MKALFLSSILSGGFGTLHLPFSIIPHDDPQAVELANILGQVSTYDSAEKGDPVFTLQLFWMLAPPSCYRCLMSTASTLQREHLASLYRRAFLEYGASALWSSRAVSDPTPEDALAITRSLRVEGDLGARRLAELIEEACRAPH